MMNQPTRKPIIFFSKAPPTRESKNQIKFRSNGKQLDQLFLDNPVNFFVGFGCRPVKPEFENKSTAWEYEIGIEFNCQKIFFFFFFFLGFVSAKFEVNSRPTRFSPIGFLWSKIG